MNQLTIIGNLTRSPESRTVGDSTVCNFDVAVNRDYKRDGQPEADFFRVAAWGKIGENCQKYLDKGKKVAVTGEVSCRAYEAKDGTHKAQMEVHTNKVEFLSPRGEQTQDAPQEDAGDMAGFTDIKSEDIPF
jgi:single-strand DNA-binding protein